MTREDHSNHWRGMREDTVMKRQHRGLSVPGSDSANPPKKIITDKYNNRMNPKKLKKIK